MTDYDAAAVREFSDDLEGMDDAEIASALKEVTELIDWETSWQEALCAEQRIRAKSGTTK